MEVPFINHTRHWNAHGKEYLELFDRVLRTGQYQGEHTTDALEEVLREFTGRRAVVVQSGTEALTMALRAIKAPPDAEVIVPAYSFPATASAVLRAGLKPVFVDVTPSGFMDYDRLNEAITNNTAAIVPVTMFGRSFFLDEPKRYKAFMIWDNAQGFSKLMCHHGFMNCVSFDPMKVMPAFGSAGAIFCDDEMMEFLLKGMRKNDPFCPIPSQNSQVSALISAGLIRSIEFYETWQSQRKAVREAYKSGISLSVQDCWEGYSTDHKFPIFSRKRDQLKEYLAEHGIQTKVHYPYVLPSLPMFGSEDPDKYPNAKKLSETELSLPIYPMMSADEVYHVINKVNDFVADTSD